VISGKTAHRRWHEEIDERQAAASFSREDDLLYYDSLRPPVGYKPDEGREIVPLEPLTLSRLEGHRKWFEPPKDKLEALRQHRQACDEVAALFGLTGDSLKRMVLDLRRQGRSFSEIAEETGMSLKDVRELARAV